ncbi:hypothetical protein [Rhodothermus marinus]|uniref:hypothetical protein n=1 Tax=Rhodothermus marinus TaxID=29549 RepID=UPI0012BA40A6|nr:hypothetical protein [Rhodothermus marinus]BBM70688.1 hypothetical protein RmaAA213_25340 [Rhodothermus marinus]BBM73673.1 hypothetical protein RmaAA338_25380 [Rhodothermus marinus]
MRSLLPLLLIVAIAPLAFLSKKLPPLVNATVLAGLGVFFLVHALFDAEHRYVSLLFSLLALWQAFRYWSRHRSAAAPLS